jgi:hypothetical protein
LGILLGDDGKGGGVIDLEIDNPSRARPVLERIFPDGIPDTACFRSNRGEHFLFRYDARLARYGLTIIKGETRDKAGEDVVINPFYVGVEFRIGTIDPGHPEQIQSVVPPTSRDDGTPREWMDRDGEILSPVEVFADPDRFILSLPGCVFADLDRYAHAGPGTPESETDPTWDKEEVKSAVLPHALALAKEWGLRVTGSRPTAKGFVECRAIDRKDAEPSCGFNPTTGVYTDRATGLDLSLFNLALTLKVAPDFSSLVNMLGRRFGVPPAARGAATKATKATKVGADSCEGGVKSLKSLKSQPDPHEDDIPVNARQWPDPPDPAVWHGPAGKLALAVRSFTEADEVGILVQCLVGWANLVGRNPFFQVNSTKHFLNLFACTTGPTAMGRKGTAWDIVLSALSGCDPEWAMGCVKSGLTSGEGLIWEIRDEITKQEAIREKGQPARYEEAIVDAGVSDKRLMAVETEFGGTLKVLTRDGNTLSAVIRQCWDSGILRTITKNNPARATDAHVSIVAHITEQEVARYLSANDAANGFANRILWVAVRQTRYLPDGAAIPLAAIVEAQAQLKAAAAEARQGLFRMERDPDASVLWHSVYRRLCQGRPGLLGAILGRAVPQVMRLACVYALMDLSTTIHRVHLEAALALWDYCERSAAYIFGDSLGDRDADHLLSVLRSSPLGLSQSQIVHDVFNRHKSREEVAKILGRLLEARRVHSESIRTGGRPATVWHATDMGDTATKATNATKAPNLGPDTPGEPAF